MSVPANVTFAPGAAGRLSTSRVPWTSVCSTMTTAVAPRGTTAPVATDTAAPADTVATGTEPGDTGSGCRSSDTGLSSDAPNVSSARTANPSTFERSNPGTSTGARTSSASTRR